MMKLRSATIIGLGIMAVYFADWVVKAVNPPPQQCWVTLKNDEGLTYQKYINCDEVEVINKIASK